MPTTAHTRPDKILVVDDDARIRDLLKRYLTQEGFDVLLAEDGRALTRLLLRETVDMIVLDLMLPGEDGLSICRRLRSQNDRTPIIMLTAKSEDVDKIVGLEVGADDYLSKPFNPRELLARIHAVLRRRPVMEAPGAPSREAQTVVFGPFEFDLALRRLTRDGEVISLTTGEFSMLKALVRHPRQPLSRDKLAQLARGRDLVDILAPRPRSGEEFLADRAFLARLADRADRHDHADPGGCGLHHGRDGLYRHSAGDQKINVAVFALQLRYPLLPARRANIPLREVIQTDINAERLIARISIGEVIGDNDPMQ